MKWIYRILRLFFCPHRYQQYDVEAEYYFRDEKRPSRITAPFKCDYCGDIKVVKLTH